MCRVCPNIKTEEPIRSEVSDLLVFRSVIQQRTVLIEDREVRVRCAIRPVQEDVKLIPQPRRYRWTAEIVRWFWFAHHRCRSTIFTIVAFLSCCLVVHSIICFPVVAAGLVAEVRHERYITLEASVLVTTHEASTIAAPVV